MLDARSLLMIKLSPQGDGTLMLSTLIGLGYKVTFSSLQADHYSVDQTQRRLIIIRAGPGVPLLISLELRYIFSGKIYNEITFKDNKCSSTFTTAGGPG